MESLVLASCTENHSHVFIVAGIGVHRIIIIRGDIVPESKKRKKKKKCFRFVANNSRRAGGSLGTGARGGEESE